ncbi:hypothetical protein JX265_006935 [Neoarthrinium moseri]|uniref:DNA replication checkpoint mediator MRC1 domain-containing protein n=1 Tax=Neoarthrinium moseri TaxID=1658444 RepID=A0A9P9WLH5_9PEZI|nr:hypothetical protein JX265_006935 [Neoarthrinium moseri]
MASLRSPSPASDASRPASPQLTPRSKLQAELAALDESSGDEDARPINRKALFKSPAKPTGRTSETLHKEDGDDDDDDQEDDDEDVIRPRGRLAARMQANDDTDKQELAPKSPQKAPEAVNEPMQSANDVDAGGNGSNDDDDVSTAPRKRRIRAARSRTPETALNREQSPASPGLFVSPNASQRSAAESDSDADLPNNLAQNSRFQALVARKREQRLAKEAEEKKKRDERAQRVAEAFPDADDDDDDMSDISDDDAGRKLTQELSRPSARKASKKALEEMNRETQRLSRSMQLAHEAKTKKKISKSSLFERFNFKTPAPQAPQEIPPTSSSRPTTPVSAAQTDAEMAEEATPPSSPPSAVKKMAALNVGAVQEQQADAIQQEAKESELPSLADVIPPGKSLDKGKGKATLADLESPKKKTPSKPKRQFRVKLPAVQANMTTIDLDDELEIEQPKKQSKIDAIFSRVPAQQTKEARSVHVLRQLAHVSSPPQDSRKRHQKPSMTVGELQLNLQQRARAQAKLERERRLEALKAKGVHVQTEEEREKEREEVEDIVARARQEAEEIMARELDDAKKAKKERKENGEQDHLDWDDSDDDSFVGSDDEPLQPIEEGEIEFSGSDEEENDEVEDESAGNPMFDEDAEEADESEGDDVDGVIESTVTENEHDEDADDTPRATSKFRRPRKHTQILSDDKDETPVAATPKPKSAFFKSPSGPNSDSPKAPTSVLRSATKTFIPGLSVPAACPAGLGLTQIFAGTMDDSQAASAAPTSGSPVEFMPSFENFPDSQFSATAGTSQPAGEDMVLDSQTETQRGKAETQGVQLNFEQSQMHGFDSLMQMDNTQASDLLNPSQDTGFADFSPLKRRFVDPPHSTVDTVLLNGSPAADPEVDVDQMESPLVRRRGKLIQRREVSFAEDSTLPPTAIPGSPLVKMTAAPRAVDAEVDDDGVSAFRLMAKAARRKKRQEKFDAKKSKAKEMVEGEAEESEDEYAGLGGADGEDSSDDEDLEELRKQMIDDAKGNEDDEGKLAAFFADRERAADSAQVDKLFRDITTGMLRKRRRGGGGGNGDFDLSDSDDGGEARRRLKRKQFAKMQKALFADERIGKIAENPRNAAFMKSIEDRDSDEEMGFDEPYFVEEEEDSQPQDNNQAHAEQSEDSVPDSQPQASTSHNTTNLGRKRTRTDSAEAAARPPPNAKRTKGGPRPTSIADVRRSLSSLLGEPNLSFESVIPATDPAEPDSEDDEQSPAAGSPNKENRRPGSVAVVDRISLKRSGSSNLSTSSKLAFAAAAGSSSASSSGAGGFKVPALLRRATTNSLMSQASSTSTSTSTSSATTPATHGSGRHGAAGTGFGDDAKLKKNAGKRSGVNFFARENERREKLKESERRREERKWKGVEGRGKVVGGLFGGGSFE